MSYTDLIIKYKDISSKFNVQIDVELTNGNSPIQEIKDNTIYLNIDSIALDDLKLDMIIAGCFEDNVASKKMLEKLDFIFEGKKHKALWDAVDGPKDLLYFYREKN